MIAGLLHFFKYTRHYVYYEDHLCLMMPQNFQSSLFFQLTDARDWHFCVLEFVPSMAQKTPSLPRNGILWIFFQN